MVGISANAQITFDCEQDAITTVSKCDDCGGGVSKASFTGLRFKDANGVVIQEISFPFQVNMMSQGLVCVKELGDDQELFCLDKKNTAYTYTTQLFDALVGCQTSLFGGGGNAQHRDGSILWVSDDGDNATGAVGNMHKPFSDPWAARDAATAGDIIFILSGTFDAAAILPADPNLFNKAVVYHMLKGTRIIGNATTAEPIAGGDYGITGNGVLENYRIDLQTLGNNIDFVLELDKLIVSDAASAANPVIRTDCDNCNIDINLKRISFNGTLNYVFQIGGDDTKTNIVINDLFFETTGVSGWQVFRQGGGERSQTYLQVNNALVRYDMSGTGGSAQDGIFATPDFYGLIRGLFVDSQITGRFGNVTIQNTAATHGGTPNDKTFTGKAVFTIGSGYGSTFENTQVDVKFGNILTPNKIMDVHIDNSQGGGTCQNSTFNIDLGNATSTESVGVSVVDLQGADVKVNVKGNVICEKRNVIQSFLVAPVGNICFTGRYETRLAGAAVADIDNKISFRNSILINDATVAPIISSGALTIPIMATFSNSLIVDANTTEAVSPMVRDVNVN